MILLFDKVQYEYDVRGLITTFFPGAAVETRGRELLSGGDAAESPAAAGSDNRLTGKDRESSGDGNGLAGSDNAGTKPKIQVDKAGNKWICTTAEDELLLKKAEAYGEKVWNGGNPTAESELIDEEACGNRKADSKIDLKGHKEGKSDPEADQRRYAVVYGNDYIAVCAIDGEKCYLSAAYAGSGADSGKNQLKRMTYQIFSRMTGGQVHPWGTLTGIRPIKLPMAMIEQGMSDQDIASALKKNYLIGDEKCGLSIKIAHKERALLDVLDYEDGYSMYIGIPFCPTTCLYCSFTSYPFGRWEKRMGEYVDALERELAYVKEAFAGRKLNTIYFGGGTPTTLPPVYLDRILRDITEGFDLSYLKEWTVEGGRPDSITPEKLQVMRQYPVDRISINPQTMKQATLDLIGRRHTVEDVKRAFGMARDAGFDNINMDLIIGLPQERIEDVAYTMEEIKALNPDNLTVHTLAIKRASRLNTEKEQYGHLYLERNTSAMMDITAKGAAEMGMEPYYLYRQKNMSGNLENVGYAKPGKEGIYNILIMEEKQSIVALGAGSVTKRVKPDGVIERASNVKDVEQYLTRTDEMIERKRKLFEN